MMDADAATSAAGASARPAAAGTRAAAGPAVEFQDVGKRYGSVAAVDGISFAIARGTLVTLLGPSGCGKTTTLRLIAGLEAPSSGRILIGGRDVTLLSAAERDVSMVFQSYALFPHMTVLENACYGLRASGLRRARAEEMARAKLALVGLEGFEARLPSELSGGQQQRVAVARAIVLEPQVLLFDEPLSNLDAKLRRRVREEIRGLQQSLGLTVAYVTHDQEEALAVSDRIIVMNGGRIAQDGPPRALYERPASRFVADFIGDANILPAVVDSVADGRAQVRLGPALLSLPDAGVPPGPALLAARPEAVALSRLPAHDAASGLAGVVRKTAYVGSHMEYEIAVEAPACALFATDRDVAAPLTPGDAVQIVLAATGVTLVPGD